MKIFNCKYLNHENEEIIGFCLNQNCQHATQYCYQCLNTTHQEHFNDCIRYTNMIQFINEFIKVHNQSRIQFKDISKQFQNCFDQIQKQMDQNIQKLESMIQQLENQEYLTFKSQIHIIKHFYKKEKENYIQQQLIQFIQKKVKQYNQIIFYRQQRIEYNTKYKVIIKLFKIIQKKKIQIVEVNQISDDQKPDHIQKTSIKSNFINNIFEPSQFSFIYSSRRQIDHLANQLYIYFILLKGCKKIIQISTSYQILRYKDTKISHQTVLNGLDNIYKFILQKSCRLQETNQEAIEYLDKAIEFYPKFDSEWFNKGFELSVCLYCLRVIRYFQKQQEAIECLDKAIEVNPKFYPAWNEKGVELSIHFYCLSVILNLQKFKEAIECLDKAIEINPQYDHAQYNKGVALSIHLYCLRVVHMQGEYKEAIVCFDKVIFMQPKFDSAWFIKGVALSIHYIVQGFYICNSNTKELLSVQIRLLKLIPNLTLHGLLKDFHYPINQNYTLLHKLSKFQDAIKYYDKALTIRIKHTYLRFKADSLQLIKKFIKIFEIGNKYEAQTVYYKAQNRYKEYEWRQRRNIEA